MRKKNYKFDAKYNWRYEVNILYDNLSINWFFKSISLYDREKKNRLFQMLKLKMSFSYTNQCVHDELRFFEKKKLDDNYAHTAYMDFLFDKE